MNVSLTRGGERKTSPGERAQVRGAELGCRHEDWVEALTGAFRSGDLVSHGVGWEEESDFLKKSPQ